MIKLFMEWSVDSLPFQHTNCSRKFIYPFLAAEFSKGAIIIITHVPLCKIWNDTLWKAKNKPEVIYVITACVLLGHFMCTLCVQHM